MILRCFQALWSKLTCIALLHLLTMHDQSQGAMYICSFWLQPNNKIVGEALVQWNFDPLPFKMVQIGEALHGYDALYCGGWTHFLQFVLCEIKILKSIDYSFGPYGLHVCSRFIILKELIFYTIIHDEHKCYGLTT